jgi:N-acetylneuraminic acid mutarotase
MILFGCKSIHQKEQSIEVDSIEIIPEAVTNNAVALIKKDNDVELYTFNGLSANKKHNDIHHKAFVYKNNSWQELNTPVRFHNVLASTAVSIDSHIYLIGGYTVAEDHTEISTVEINKYDTTTNQWSLETKMPTPVDDTVALVYKNRYIYLISGWYDKDNVSTVQVYDTQIKQWFKATEYPAPAVFGHAGGIVDNKLLVCDGVKVVNYNNKPREFVSSSECWLGIIDESNLANINWQQIPHHSDTAYYRMAATGDSVNNRIVFAGGSDNPYNYDGIGYNKNPSQASELLFSYDLVNNKWHFPKQKLPKNMDHRALLFDDEWFYILGGMESNQKVSNKVIRFKYE